MMTQTLMNEIEALKHKALKGLKAGPYRTDVLRALLTAQDALVCYQELGPTGPQE